MLVGFPSTILDLYKTDFDFDSLRTQLYMLLDANQTSGMERGQMVLSVVSAMNGTNVAKARSIT